MARRGRNAGKAVGVTLQWYGDDLARAIGKAGEKGLWEAGQVILREAKRRAPVRSGRLRESGYVATWKRSNYRKQKRDKKKLPPVVKGAAVVAFANWPGNLVEDSGAKAHGIPYRGKAGRARKVLKIPGIGFRRLVKHPGMKRRPFLGPALEASKGALGEAFAKPVRAEVEREMPK